MISISLPVDWRVIVSVLVGLAGLATGYNVAIGKRENRSVPTSWLVVVGVSFTLAGYALIMGIVPALVAAACFVASGLPMIIGDHIRNSQEQKETTERLRKMFKDMGNGEA